MKRAVLAVFAAASLAGCGGGGASRVDETDARAVLVKALDAWIAGTPAADLRASSPEVIVVDQQWTAGMKLVDYEIVGLGTFDGKNLRAPVNLVLGGTPARRANQKVSAEYVVGLQPVVTVTRVME